MPIIDFIRAQPETVAAVAGHVADELARWSIRSCRNVTLIGSGTSLHALLAMRDMFESHGPIRVMGPSRYLAEPRESVDPLDLTVVLSQSGASATSVAAAQAAIASRASTIVLTGEAASPIAAIDDAKVIVMPIGPEPIGPKTKGYTASIAALAALRQHLDLGSQEPLEISLDRRAVDAAQQAGERLASELDDTDYVLIAGNGRHEATALEASLKISEIVGLPAVGFSIEEALHGRLHGLSPRSIALLIAAEPGELDIASRAAQAMRERAVPLRVLNLCECSSPFDWMRFAPLRAPLDTLTAILPFQWLAVALALRRGLDPEAMRYPGLSRALGIKLVASG